MIILTIRTDKPEAEIGLYEDAKQLDYDKWLAHRQLAETLHKHIVNLLYNSGKTLQDIGGIVIFEGPGSFTGLRIGVSVANALAYSLGRPVTGSTGDDWIKRGQQLLEEVKGQASTQILPVYGQPPHVTKQRK